jgi:hypothetical protein
MNLAQFEEKREQEYVLDLLNKGYPFDFRNGKSNPWTGAARPYSKRLIFNIYR